jgi:hypothetical protein
MRDIARACLELAVVASFIAAVTLYGIAIAPTLPIH